MYGKLRETRKLKKVTCEQLSAVLGFKTRGAYHKKENGLVPFTLLEAKLISDYLEKPIEDIFFVENVSQNDISR